MFTQAQVDIFLMESNGIEGVYGKQPLLDAIKAWQTLLFEDKLSTLAILNTHRILMANQRPDIAGHFRRVGVRVGDYIAPNAGSLRRLMFMWHNDWATAKTQADIKKAHIAFENVHPFEDGNGRVGRIILNWQRVRAGLPILIIKESERESYYEWFKK